MTTPHLPKPNEGSFTHAPAGTFPAICYRVIDLGTQDTTFQGKPNRKHKILISWELKDDEAIFKDPETGQEKPMSVHQQYTWSMGEKANLRKALESWRGQKFTDADFGPGGFDIRKLLGQPCMMGIVHTENNGSTYANISAISKLPKSMKETIGSLSNEKQFLWLDEGLFDQPTFDKLSDKMKEKIMASPEYKELINGKGDEHVGDGDDNGSAPPFDDEIPF